MSSNPSLFMSPILAEIKPLESERFSTGSNDVPFAICTHAVLENIEKEIRSWLPSPFKSPTDRDVALSHDAIGVEIVIPEEFQSAHTIVVE